MKNLLLTITLFACLSMAANAQISIDVRAGFNLAKYGGNDAKAWGFLDVEPGWKSGYHFGGSVYLHNFQPIVFEGGLYFSAKGTKYNGKTNDFGGGEMVSATTIKDLKYIDIPLHVRYFFNEHLNIYAGPQISFLLSAKATDKVENREDEDFDVKDEYNSIDLSIDIGVAYQMDNGLNFQLGYDHGLLDIVKYGNNSMEYTVMNRVIKISVGYKLYRSGVKKN